MARPLVVCLNYQNRLADYRLCLVDPVARPLAVCLNYQNRLVDYRLCRVAHPPHRPVGRLICRPCPVVRLLVGPVENCRLCPVARLRRQPVARVTCRPCRGREGRRPTSNFYRRACGQASNCLSSLPVRASHTQTVPLWAPVPSLAEGACQAVLITQPSA